MECHSAYQKLTVAGAKKKLPYVLHNWNSLSAFFWAFPTSTQRIIEILV